MFQSTPNMPTQHARFRWPLILGLLGLLCLAGCVIQGQSSTPSRSPSAPIIIPEDASWSERMALSIMTRNPEAWMTDFRESPRWSYTHGLIMMSMQRLWQHNSDERFWNYAKSYADTMIDAQGQIRDYDITEFNIDHVNAGKILFVLYERSADPRYRTAIETLRTQLRWQPRTTEGGFWHKLRYPWQMWLDGLYMGSPFLAEYGKRFGDSVALDDVAHQILLMEQRAMDPETGLLRHGYDDSRLQQWSNDQTGLSENIWGRAVGWYAMAVVDVLDHLPNTHPQRQAILAVLQRLADAVKPYQSEHGLWYQVLDMPEAEGNYEEATVSSMLTYALAHSVNQGYLPESYLAMAQQAYQGILTHLVEIDDDGVMSLQKCCAVAGLGGDPYRDGTYQYYINEEVRANDPKGTGPFILASLEFERLGLEFSR